MGRYGRTLLGSSPWISTSPLDGRHPAVVASGLALLAACLLAFRCRGLPSTDAKHGFALTSGGLRSSSLDQPGACAFARSPISRRRSVLLAGAGICEDALMSRGGPGPAFETTNILRQRAGSFHSGRTPEQNPRFYVRCSGAQRDPRSIASRLAAPWPCATAQLLRWFQFSLEGPDARERPWDYPRALFARVTAALSALGCRSSPPRLQRGDGVSRAEPSSSSSTGLAQQLFPPAGSAESSSGCGPRRDEVHRISPTRDSSSLPRPDIDDERVEPHAGMTVYHPSSISSCSRLFVQYARESVTRWSPRPPGRCAKLALRIGGRTGRDLDDVRAEVLAAAVIA